LSLAGYAQEVASWFHREARTRFLLWANGERATEKDARITWDQIARSPCCSILKARRTLEYRPQYTSLEALRESVDWLVSNGVIRI
jgi:nucleoside-diphosphate-sugar epimerase